MFEEEEQLSLRQEISAFVETHVVPYANVWDKQGYIPKEVIQDIANRGYLGFTIPYKYGGRGENQLDYGILNEEIGRGCSSLRSLLTVHTSLVAETINKWGTIGQKNEWLSLLAKGKKIAAFALSEPAVGSDAKSISTAYQKTSEGYVINGHKKWITFGEIADVFLVVAKNQESISTFLINNKTPGLIVKPLRGIMGTRASMLAEIHLKKCEIPSQNLLGREGMGFIQIVNTALDNGRYSVACGSTGIAKACLLESIAYAKERKQFGKLLKEHQLIKQKISNMITDVKTSQLLCRNAGNLRDQKSPDAIIQTSIAKYIASTASSKASINALQIHGAYGCMESRSLQRYYRDAKVMEIIEGSTEIQQLIIADQGFQNLASILD